MKSGMLKDEPKLQYWWEVINTQDTHYYLGELLKTEIESMDKEHYKLKCTYRPSFIGDMQEQLDKVMQCNNMKKFAECVNQKNPSIEYRNRYIECDYSLKGLITHIIDRLTVPIRKWNERRTSLKWIKEREKYWKPDGSFDSYSYIFDDME